MIEQELTRRFNYTAKLQIPEFRFNEQEPYRRLLFHYSPRSRVEQRGSKPLIPQAPLVHDNLLPIYQEKLRFWGKLVPNWARKPHLFFFIDEPFPEEWKTRYPWYFEACLAYIRKGVQEPTHVFALLTKESDEVYVVDREPMAKLQWTDEIFINRDAVLPYVRSRLLLREYSEGYNLPEVIIPHAIESDRLIDLGQVFIPDVPDQFRPKSKIIGPSKIHLRAHMYH